MTTSISQQRQAIELYQNLMREIKVRLESMTTLTSSTIPLPVKLAQEYCWLQIRMTCELIALGCLVAHGDITKSNKFTKTYQADKIMNTLENLHVSFFPIPVKRTRTEMPRGWHLEPLKSGYLTKTEFLKLYNQRCGYELHRGSLKTILTKAKVMVPAGDFSEIQSWITKIMKLLDHHSILLLGSDEGIVCQMSNADTGGDVQAAFIRKLTEHS
jgi:hypothetical protein